MNATDIQPAGHTAIWSALEVLTDPEIPVVTLRELGILRDIQNELRTRR